MTSFCTLLLSYQSWYILQQYLKKNIVTNIQFVSNNIDNLPGITLCFDNLISFERMAQVFPEFSFQYLNYSKLLSKIANIKDDKTDKNSDASLVEQSIMFDDVLKKMCQHVFGTFWHNPASVSQISSYRDTFDKLTVKLFNEVTKFKRFQIEFHGEILNQDQFTGYFAFNESTKIYEIISNPIESLIFLPGRKCFTYFSSLQIPFRLFRASITRLKILAFLPTEAFPFNPNAKIFIAIHSPNIIPSLDKFNEINQATWTRVYYSKIENNQIADHGHCSDYDLNHREIHKMKSHCVFDCVKNSFHVDCLKFILFTRNIPMTKELLPDFHLENGCQWSDLSNLSIVERECERNCKDECYESFYLYETKLSYPNSNRSLYKNHMEIDVEPSSMPNVIIAHLPEMTFLSLLCNFGGLVGMVLGTSLLSIINITWIWSRNIVNKIISLNVSNKFCVTPVLIISPSIRHNNNSSDIIKRWITRLVQRSSM